MDLILLTHAICEGRKQPQGMQFQLNAVATEAKSSQVKGQKQSDMVVSKNILGSKSSESNGKIASCNPNISQLGMQQCKKLAEILNWDSIGLILVSPMPDCLQTCRLLMQYSNIIEKYPNINIYVEPLICNQIANGKKGLNKKELQTQYPQFCFDCLSDCQTVPWYLSNICIRKKMAIQGLKNVKFMEEHNIEEDCIQFRSRILKFKRNLLSHLSSLSQGKRILIISHNKVLRTMTAKFYSSDGQSRSDLVFQKGQLNFVKSTQIFHPLLPSPSL